MPFILQVSMRLATRPHARTLVVAGEQRVFRRELDRPDPIFDEVAVHLDAPVVQQDQQPVPLAGGIGQLLTEPGLGRDVRWLLVELHAEGVHQRCGLGPSHELAIARTGASPAAHLRGTPCYRNQALAYSGLFANANVPTSSDLTIATRWRLRIGFQIRTWQSVVMRCRITP